MATQLSKENLDFIKSEVQAGHFPTIEDAVNAAVHLMRDSQEALSRFAREGLDSGTAVELDIDELIERGRNRHGY